MKIIYAANAQWTTESFYFELPNVPLLLVHLPPYYRTLKPPDWALLTLKNKMDGAAL